MAAPTPANPSISPQNYDPVNHQSNVALKVTNIQTDSSVTPNVTYGDLGIQVDVTTGPPTDILATGTIAGTTAVTATFGQGAASWTVDIDGTIGAGTVLQFEYLVNTTWRQAFGVVVGSNSDVSTSSVTLASAGISYQGNAAGFQQFRVRCSSYNGTDSLNIKIVGSVATDGGFVSKSLPPGTNTIGAVTGNVASGATDSGNPMKIGGVYNSAAPTLSNGQRGDAQLDVNGNLKVAGTFSSTPPASVVSTVNSTTTLLTANSVFTGTSESSLAYGSISVEAFADQASAASGLVVQQSQDNTNWDIQNSYTVSASTSFQQTINLVGQYYRVKYTNGGTNQGAFRLQTIKMPAVSPSAGAANQRVNAQSGDFVDGAIATIGALADTAVIAPGSSGSVVALLKGLLTELIDIEAQTTLTPTVSGTVTANAGTNLNTSLLALEAGGNLATLVTNTADLLADGDNLPTIATNTTNIGASADAAVVGDNAGSLSAKLRGLTKILNDIWDSTNHLFHLNVKQVAGTTTSVNAGTADAGTQRVTLASDQKVPTKAASGDFADGSINTLGAQGDAVVTSSASSGTAMGFLKNLATIAGAIISSVMQSNIKQIGGVSTQMANIDGVLPTNLLAEGTYLYDSGGPVDSTGKPQQAAWGRLTSLQGKVQAGSSANITSTLQNDTNLVFSSAPKTIMPGQKVSLAVGGGNPVETVIVSSTYTPSSSATTIPLQYPVVNASSTTAKWDVFGPTGPGAAKMSAFGLLPVASGMNDINGGGTYLMNNSSNDNVARAFFQEVGMGISNSATASAGNLDVMRGNLDNISLVASAAYTTTQTSADQTNYNGRGVIVTLDMTNVAAGPSVTLEIDMKDPVSGKYVSLLTGAAVTTVSTNVYTVYPGAPATANVSANSPLPRTWRVKVTAGNSNSGTYSVGASVIV